jgi:hypothetical protein
LVNTVIIKVERETMSRVNLPLIVTIVVSILLVSAIGTIIYYNGLSSKSPSTATPTPVSTTTSTPEPSPTITPTPEPTTKTYDMVITYSRPYQVLQWVTRNESDSHQTTEQITVVAIDVEFSNYTKNWTFETEKFYVFNEHQPFPRTAIPIEKTINIITSNQWNVSSTKLYFDIPYQSNLVLGYSNPNPINALWIQEP